MIQTYPNAENEVNPPENPSVNSQGEQILCPHCRRTATNGIRCLGMCVADHEY